MDVDYGADGTPSVGLVGVYSYGDPVEGLVADVGDAVPTGVDGCKDSRCSGEGLSVDL